MKLRATYFCIDIECNGPVPGLYDMVSLGAIVVKSVDGRPRLGQKFYVEIRPEAPRFDAAAAAIHGLDQNKLHREGLPRAEACRQLIAWVARHTDVGSQSVFVGHNAPFDWSFVAWTFAAENLKNPFGYKALDTKALAMGVLDLHWLNSSKDTIQGILNLPLEDKDKKHRADYDAEYQALILVGLLNRMSSEP
jgi:DNA polymerase III alpha subunit (gram-positive type)